MGLDEIGPAEAAYAGMSSPEAVFVYTANAQAVFAKALVEAAFSTVGCARPIHAGLQCSGLNHKSRCMRGEQLPANVPQGAVTSLVVSISSISTSDGTEHDQNTL